ICSPPSARASLTFRGAGNVGPATDVESAPEETLLEPRGSARDRWAVATIGRKQPERASARRTLPRRGDSARFGLVAFLLRFGPHTNRHVRAHIPGARRV